MRAFLLDADAFLALRSLSLLNLLRHSPQIQENPFQMTFFIARHELHQVSSTLQQMEEEGTLQVQESLSLRTEAGQKWRELRRQRGTHKGEAEAIAWALKTSSEERPLFVSCDRRARQTAGLHGVLATDVLGLVVETVEERIFSKEEAQAYLKAWDDRQQQLCRPPDFTTFEETYQRRLALRDKDS